MGKSGGQPCPGTQVLWRRLWDGVAAAVDWPATLSALAFGWRDITQARQVRITAPRPDGTGLWRLDLDAESTAQCQHVEISSDVRSGAIDQQADSELGDTRRVLVQVGDRVVSTVFVTGSVAWEPDRVDPLVTYHGHTLARLQSDAPQLRHSLGEDLGDVASVVPDDFRLESLAEFAAGAGHEINNPLATIIGRVQLLLRKETDPGRRQALEAIGGQAYRIRDMIGDAMMFARPPLGQCQSLDLSLAVQGVVDAFEEKTQARNCKVCVSLASDAAVWADPDQLGVVVSCLLRNALEGVDDGGQVTIETTIQPGESHLVVSNSGRGLSADERAHLFDPFYSGRQAGRGLGFGLSKCWRIVSNHGGRIECQSVLDCSTTFTVFWPSSP
ncbi:MAG: HAMP domain-containing sensor histidine kinase [Planctomycetaceae bacterium]